MCRTKYDALTRVNGEKEARVLLRTLEQEARRIFTGFEQAIGDIFLDDVADWLPCSAYLRKSVINEDTDAESIAAQLFYCDAETTRLHWVITKIYVDEGISASKGLERPGFNNVRTDMVDGGTRRLIVREQARISRDDLELFVFLQAITMADVEVRDSRGGFIRNDLSTKIKGIVDADYAAAVSKAAKEKVQLSARAGKFKKTRLRPYGYTAGYEKVVTREAEVLREGKDRMLAGEKLFHIARDWRDRGIKTTTGRLWTPAKLSKALRRPENAGMRGYREMVPSDSQRKSKVGPLQIVAHNACPKIWSEKEYDRIIKAMADNKSFSRNTARKYLLSSVLVCADPRCAMGVAARTSGKGAQYSRYYCNPDRGGCGKTSLPMYDADEYVIRVTYKALKMMPKVTEKVEDTISPEIDRIEGEIEELAVARESGELSLNEYLRFKKPLDNQLVDLRKQRTQAQAVPLPVDDAEDFLNAPTDKKRATIKRLWGHIGVTPGPSKDFNPKRLVIEPNMPLATPHDDVDFS